MDELPDNESKMKKRNLDAEDIWESQTIPLTVVDAKQSPHVQARLVTLFWELNIMCRVLYP